MVEGRNSKSRCPNSVPCFFRSKEFRSNLGITSIRTFAPQNIILFLVKSVLLSTCHQSALINRRKIKLNKITAVFKSRIYFIFLQRLLSTFPMRRFFQRFAETSQFYYYTIFSYEPETFSEAQTFLEENEVQMF